MELVKEYALGGSEAAFETLVSRHVGLVYSAALRQVRDVHLAEEISQIVFTLLARKAGSLNKMTILPGWLYRTTRFVSCAALKNRRRRENREREAYLQTMPIENSSDTVWKQLEPSLDEAMTKLRDQDRDAIILRYFQNRSLREVGSVLGLDEYAAQKRVARALEKLRSIFERSGISPTSAMIVAALLANSVVAAPAPLAKTISAISVAKGISAGVSTLTILQETAKIMAWNKLKVSVAAGIMLACVVVPVALQHGASSKMSAHDGNLRKESEAVARLQTEHANLSTFAENVELSKNQLEDLQKLRVEVEKLRENSKEVALLQREKLALQSKTPQSKPKNAIQIKEEAISKLSDNRNWVVGFYQYAAQHGGVFPTNFDQAANFMPEKLKNQKELTADRFEIVFTGSPSSLQHPNETIAVREKEAWQAGETSKPPGKWAKVYTFVDGHSEIHHETANDFTEYERQHTAVPAGH
ncbi:MAG: polymerase, sigma-24 subunit, subfamily [Verrucomicrobiales bacterium]|nr:polymerase, sigma-24 subunit, subfamily [Verrucomicrobiales bacterium]